VLPVRLDESRARAERIARKRSVREVVMSIWSSGCVTRSPMPPLTAALLLIHVISPIILLHNAAHRRSASGCDSQEMEDARRPGGRPREIGRPLGRPAKCSGGKGGHVAASALGLISEYCVDQGGTRWTHSRWMGMILYVPFQLGDTVRPATELCICRSGNPWLGVADYVPPKIVISCCGMIVVVVTSY
jgi:hypothetical protein